MSNRPPVNIRSNPQTPNDPYISDESLQDNTVCKNCGSVYVAGRWYPKGLSPEKAVEGKPHETVCAACRRSQDRVPGGVLKLSGAFIWSHRDEILNLIRNESNDALADNPLERVMSLETEGEEMIVATTNEKLAQRIGRALHKAYDGDIEYKWSESNKLARVNWHRE